MTRGCRHSEFAPKRASLPQGNCFANCLTFYCDCARAKAPNNSVAPMAMRCLVELFCAFMDLGSCEMALDALALGDRPTHIIQRIAGQGQTTRLQDMAAFGNRRCIRCPTRAK
jgi:hypothetical protein